MAAQIAVRDDASELAFGIDNADAAEALFGHRHQRLGHDCPFKDDWTVESLRIKIVSAPLLVNAG